MASHCNALSDVYPDKAIIYNRLAAEQNYSRGMFSTAVNNYNNAISIIEKGSVKVGPEKVMDLYLSYVKCLLDEQRDSKQVTQYINKAYDLINTSNFNEKYNINWTNVELSLMNALNNYRNRKFEEACIQSNEIVNDDRSSDIQKARAQFYYAASLPPQKVGARKEAHLDVLKTIDELLENDLSKYNKIELLKLKSEAANNTGFIFLHGLNNPEQAIIYFEEAVGINKMKEINDQKGIAISHTGLGDVYNKLGNSQKAEQMYQINLAISEKSGDVQGICIMCSKLGAIKLNAAKKTKGDNRNKNLKEAMKLYEKSLSISEEQSNPINICFALSGMLNTILFSGLYDQISYICTKLEEISEKINVTEIPVFAKEILLESLKEVAEATPENKILIEKQVNAFSL